LITVGITAIGGGAGQNIMAALRDSSLRTRIVGFDASPWGAGVYECDVAHRVPLASHPDYISALLDHCRAEHLQVLIPGSDPELLPLSEAAPGFEALGIQVLVSSPECIRVCRDKLATYRTLAPRGAPIVTTWSLDEARARPDELPYPLIATPLSGSASRGVAILMGPEDWDRIPTLEPMVVQPYLIPSAWQNDPATFSAMMDRLERTREPISKEIRSMQAVLDQDGEILALYDSVTTMRSGIPVESRPVENEQAKAAFQRLMDALAPLGLRVTCNAQGFDTCEGLRFFEVNPRFGGSTHLRALLGHNEVEAVVRYYALGQSRESVQALLHARTDWVALRQTHAHEVAVPLAQAQAFSDGGTLVNTARSCGSPAPAGAGKRVVILGAGGHAQVVCELLRLAGYSVIGFLDDNVHLHGSRVFGLPVLGPNEMAAGLGIDGAIVGIGDNTTRRQWFDRLMQLCVPLLNVAHPTAVIASNVRIGRGAVILANTSLNVNACIGDNVVINTGAIVGHDCMIEDHAHIGPAAVLCGGVRVGRGTLIGAGAVVIPLRTVGAESVIGAGSVVTSDLPERVLAVGAPARTVRPLT